MLDNNAQVTIVVLTYKSLRWLNFFMDGLRSSKQKTRYRTCIVANDATEEVRNDPRVTVDFRNSDPSEHYLAKVYRAWGEGVLNSPTQWCILANDDMWMTDYAIDELVDEKMRNPESLPCGLLVESGRIPSGMPEFVRNFGMTPETFQRREFLAYAEKIRKRGATEPGRLYQPVLFDRQEYFDLGGYPIGNIDGVSGDKILFHRYIEAGYKWTTCLGSVTYHVQEGAMRDAT